MEQVSAIYEPMISMGWVGGAPADRERAWEPGIPIPSEWTDITVAHRLRCGLEVTAQRNGFTIYDFAAWPPGVPDHGKAIRTMGEHSRASKPALVQRLRVINTHLTLLHAAAMSAANESPAVTRVGERDLFRQDVDETGQHHWYRPLGADVSAAVSVIDRHRSGDMPVSTFVAALDDIDRVIADNVLIDFDLLNRAQTSVSTHDYPLAVVAGWTVCELRLRALARAAALPRKVRDGTIDGICTALAHAGATTAAFAGRLVAIRRRRNAWLHNGAEPSEAEAVEAMQLAVELLRSTVPTLSLRPTSHLLIL